jgi:hypothetical protein
MKNIDKRNCAFTHAQIADGACPYCRLPILDGAVTKVSPSGQSKTPTWKFDRVAQDLEHPDEMRRVVTMANLCGALPDIKTALPLLRQALLDTSPAVQSAGFRGAMLLADKEGGDPVGDCEAVLRQHPTDSGAVCVLLFFYGRMQFEFKSDSGRRSRQELVLRTIAEMPTSVAASSPLISLSPADDGEAYDHGKALWLRHVHRCPEDVRVMGNAANYLFVSDSFLAGELLRTCKKLEPANPEWSIRLGLLYSLEGGLHEPGVRVDWELMSMHELEDALRLPANNASQFRALECLPSVALGARDYPKARHFARELLAVGLSAKEEWQRARAVHKGNIVLGRLAVIDRDPEQAKARLSSSIAPVGGISGYALASVGPNMSLARDLLDIGERGAVLEFLRSALSLRPLSGDVLVGWIREIEGGKVPDFGIYIIV